MFDPDLLCDCFDNAVLTAGSLYEDHAHRYDSKLDGNFESYMRAFVEGKPVGEQKDALKKLINLFGAPILVKPKAEAG